MRDGVILRADIFRQERGGPEPALLGRLPYDKSASLHDVYLHVFRAIQAGYAVVFQDVRGTYASDGDFYPVEHEWEDGYDSVEWVAAQPWCSGKVGMIGGSYWGFTQLQAAAKRPPHLGAVAPFVNVSEWYEGCVYQGGAFQLGWVLPIALLHYAADPYRQLVEAGLAKSQELSELIGSTDEMERLYRHLPLNTVPILKDVPTAKFYFDWITHSRYDDYWKRTALEREYGSMDVPALHISGWYDVCLKGTLENFSRMKHEAASEIARRGQRLLVGPWTHNDFSGAYAEHDFGSASSLDFTALQLRFFDRHLKGEENGLDEEPPVRVFVMGEDVWRTEQEWPIARARYTPWYLHSDGRAGYRGGSLSPEHPEGEPRDVYLYDPRDPAPTIGGPVSLPRSHVAFNAGPRDCGPAESRGDILVYDSSPLDHPIEVTGPIAVRLYAASDATDTDFVARLVDVFPDGTSRILAEGIIRARFRDGIERDVLMEPGQVYEFSIDLVATSNLFQVGHRIRVHVTSSSFPRFDRNTNTGRALGEDGPESLRPALQTVFHDREHPSQILLPIIPR
jgi:putative CocE/NonD family hydrolase